MMMTWHGAPTIYYGDEAGVCGFTDPDSRRTYPWGHEDQDLIRYHKELIRVRKENPACRRGSGIPVYAKGGHFAFGRFLGDNHVLTIINNTEEAERMTIPVWQLEIPDGELFERQVLSMEEEFNLEKAHYLVCDGEIEIYMPPYSAAVMSHTGEN